MRLKEAENDIQNAVCEWLKLKKIFFWRQNTGGVYDVSRQSFRKMPKYALKGVADIIALINHRAYFLEIKTKKGRQSPEQKEFEKNVKENGSFYYIIRGVDDLNSIF